MAKTIYEEMGDTYTKTGDYILPDLTLLPEEKRYVDVWGQRHARYLKQHHKVRYMNLLTTGKLNSYLADIDEQAEEMFFRLVKHLAEKEGVIEKLKAENQMIWAQKMNNIQACAREIVNNELIYA